ncbi:hypothetical protein SAMN05444487_102220 [Marininema mesophilum]|uniref:Uncharacterized protein n=1 Tax=Marininema mesophilum TaxID=1048340 RepID=A0A1H2SH78_9BACL|nr:hypothetical protein [Marininema mesophilum]SDW31053.1 hypothetical protein SAMN05444487_102220 [Marininema mesophilum]
MAQETERPLHSCERFKTEDVLTSFNCQFIEAHSSDGAKVLLQKMKLIRSLPPDAEGKLCCIKHPGLLSVIDVIVVEDAVVLVHPDFSGEPLTYVVNKEQSMSPMQAITLFRKLVQVQVDLSHFPMPMWTSLDPRNICIYDDEPFVLFCGLKNHTTLPQNDQGKSLLYYLLTGEYPQNVVDQSRDIRKNLRRVPRLIRQLALDMLEKDYTEEELLAEVDRVLEELTQKRLDRSRADEPKSKPSAAAASWLILDSKRVNTPSGKSVVD